MKILVVAPCPVPSNRGTPAAILRRAESLLKYATVDMLTYPIYEPDIYCDQRLTIHRVGNYVHMKDVSAGPSIKKMGTDVFMFFRLLVLQIRNKYDIIFFEHYEASLLGYFLKPFKRRGQVFVYGAHAGLVDEIKKYRFFSGAFMMPVWTFLEGFLSTRHDKILTMSPEMREHIITTFHYNEKNIEYIPMGIRPYSHIDSITTALSKDTYNVVYTGSLAVFQNLEALIPIAEKTGESIRFFVVCGKEKEEVKDTFKEMITTGGLTKKVSLVEDASFEEMQEYMLAADVLMNLRTDPLGIPLKLFNYMNSGKPIVSFAGSAVQILNSKNAIIVQDNDYAAFAQELAFLRGNAPIGHELAIQAKKDAEVFSEEVTGKQVYDFITRPIVTV